MLWHCSPLICSVHVHALVLHRLIMMMKASLHSVLPTDKLVVLRFYSGTRLLNILCWLVFGGLVPSLYQVNQVR